MRLLLVALLLSSCTGDCSGVGAVGSMRAGDMQHGAARGGMTTPVDGDDAPAVVGVDWPEGGAYGTLEILFEAEKETTFADNDPVETPTHFGALTLGPTQATLGNRLTYQSPCDVGSAIPCYYDDGADLWVDTAVRTSLRFLHNGDGMSCYVVSENSSAGAANGTLFATTQGGTHGWLAYNTSGASDRWTGLVRSGGSAVFIRPSGTTGLQDTTWGVAYVHGTSRDPDGEVFWRGGGTISGGSANYSSAATNADPQTALAIGATANALSPYTGYIFSIACYSAIHTASEISDVWAAVEAETGALPQ